MRLVLITGLLLSFALISASADKVHVFRKHSDVVEAGLKGRVKSIVTYLCSLGNATDFCSVSMKKYNAQGFLVEEVDTTGDGFLSYKYFYNSDGLLIRRIFRSDYLPSSEDTYEYSYSNRKKTTFTRDLDNSPETIDSSVTLYDKNGNKIESRHRDIKTLNKYDEHGFLIWSSLIRPAVSIETSYVNDDKGRILKKKSSEGLSQTFLYDRNGDAIQETTVNFDSTGKAIDYFTGYCEFDKNGNYLKSITACKQKKDAFMIRRVIEYYQ